MNKKLLLQIMRQPDASACGPTCLHSVYRYFGDPIGLDEVINEVVSFETGGTLAVWLGVHALKRGYNAIIYTYNLQMFDPVWFEYPETDLRRKLISQAKSKYDMKLHIATRATIAFLDLGGKILMRDLEPELFAHHLNRSHPILTGLSSTYLYREARERGWDDENDDIRGQSAGHFVVLSGYDAASAEVLVADPLHRSTGAEPDKYKVNVHRLIGAILLGVLSYDGNLLVLEPKSENAFENL